MLLLLLPLRLIRQLDSVRFDPGRPCPTGAPATCFGQREPKRKRPSRPSVARGPAGQNRCLKGAHWAKLERLVRINLRSVSRKFNLQTSRRLTVADNEINSNEIDPPAHLSGGRSIIRVGGTVPAGSRPTDAEAEPDPSGPSRAARCSSTCCSARPVPSHCRPSQAGRFHARFAS